MTLIAKVGRHFAFALATCARYYSYHGPTHICLLLRSQSRSHEFPLINFFSFSHASAFGEATRFFAATETEGLLAYPGSELGCDSGHNPRTLYGHPSPTKIAPHLHPALARPKCPFKTRLLFKRALSWVDTPALGLPDNFVTGTARFLEKLQLRPSLLCSSR